MQQVPSSLRVYTKVEGREGREERSTNLTSGKISDIMVVRKV